jgi:hypothetical protein
MAIVGKGRIGDLRVRHTRRLWVCVGIRRKEVRRLERFLRRGEEAEAIKIPVLNA